jgi:hypothetical protein
LYMFLVSKSSGRDTDIVPVVVSLFMRNRPMVNSEDPYGHTRAHATYVHEYARKTFFLFFPPRPGEPRRYPVHARINHARGSPENRNVSDGIPRPPIPSARHCRTTVHRRGVYKNVCVSCTIHRAIVHNAHRWSPGTLTLCLKNYKPGTFRSVNFKT